LYVMRFAWKLKMSAHGPQAQPWFSLRKPNSETSKWFNVLECILSFWTAVLTVARRSSCAMTGACWPNLHGITHWVSSRSAHSKLPAQPMLTSWTHDPSDFYSPCHKSEIQWLLSPEGDRWRELRCLGEHPRMCSDWFEDWNPSRKDILFCVSMQGDHKPVLNDKIIKGGTRPASVTSIPPVDDIRWGDFSGLNDSRVSLKSDMMLLLIKASQYTYYKISSLWIL
jgi:hypothetical protein